MRKKLMGLGVLPLVSLVLFVFSSCTEDKHYTIIEDPSVNWIILEYTVDSQRGNAYPDWVWDENTRTYSCEIKEPKLSSHIYDNGALVSYVFFGEYDKDELQMLLPLHEMRPNGMGMNIRCDYSFDLDQTIVFYFHWDDYAQIDPGLFNFRVVLLSPPN